MCDCGLEFIVAVQAKCGDMCYIHWPHRNCEHDGYVLPQFGIGSGDYIEFKYCLNCGKIQGQFPLKPKLDTEDD